MYKLMESPTSLAAEAYCPRIPHLMQIKPPFTGEKSSTLVAGNIEHEFFEKYLELAKLDSTSKNNLFSSTLHQRRKLNVTKFIQNLALTNHPEFFEKWQETLKSLNFRIDGFFKILVDQAKLHFADNLSLKQTTSLLFPWKIEYWFENRKYQIHGKADFVMKAADGTLIIVDLKSHYSRIAAYMHQDEHRQQMITYAILAEWEFGIPVNKCRIFYSQDLSYEDFFISNEDKVEIIKKRNQRKIMLETSMPPRLTGADAYKCSHCYHSDFCTQISDNDDQTAVYAPVGGEAV